MNAAMLFADLEKSLALLEHQCQEVAAAVLSGAPEALEGASEALRQAALDFSALMGQLGGGQTNSPEVRKRLRAVAVQLQIQRENLLRRSVVVERALHTLLPSTRKSTYGPQGGHGPLRGKLS
jgi:hypothetical protein